MVYNEIKWNMTASDANFISLLGKLIQYHGIL